ncbi:hypothetical protein TNCV_4298731 [Trichonephila clavipes]|nr:hypothetical protein TNCV_4298731 [Trichonephila clavipes]
MARHGPFHPTTKRYWTLWDSLILRNGVLYRKGESDDGKTFSGLKPISYFRPRGLDCCRGSRSAMDFKIRGPSTTALRSREKLRFCTLQETVKYSPSKKPEQQLCFLSLTA